MLVAGEPGSEASKNLRKGFATVLSVYRDTAFDSYYGDAAAVINYPISSTSWAAPQATDEGYRVAFSVDVDGNPIYTAEMTEEAYIGFINSYAMKAQEAYIEFIGKYAVHITAIAAVLALVTYFIIFKVRKKSLIAEAKR